MDYALRGKFEIGSFTEKLGSHINLSSQVCEDNIYYSTFHLHSFCS